VFRFGKNSKINQQLKLTKDKPMYQHYRQKDFICGALVGSGVAFATAWLLTSDKGKKIKSKIAQTFEEMKENVEEKAHEVKEKAHEVKDKVEEGAEHLHKKVAHKLKHDDKDSK
jgi:gas vesicle protein